MKRLVLLMTWGAVVFASCSNKETAQKVDDTRVLMQNSVDEHGLQRMQLSNHGQVISFQGKDYHIYLSRKPDDSLEPVKSEVGDTFVDNQITLRILQGERPVLDKVFTKHSFSSVVPAGFMKKSILEGMVFDKTTSSGMVFAVSVSYPQTDLYIPISLTVSANGKMSMVREELMEEVYESEQ